MTDAVKLVTLLLPHLVHKPNEEVRKSFQIHQPVQE